MSTFLISFVTGMVVLSCYGRICILSENEYAVINYSIDNLFAANNGQDPEYTCTYRLALNILFNKKLK